MSINSRSNTTDFNAPTAAKSATRTFVHKANEQSDCQSTVLTIGPGVYRTLYQCTPFETSQASHSDTDVSTTPTIKADVTTILPNQNIPTGRCQETVRAASACPAECPASGIPGLLGMAYFCAVSRTSETSIPKTATPNVSEPTISVISTSTAKSRFVVPPQSFASTKETSRTTKILRSTDLPPATVVITMTSIISPTIDLTSTSHSLETGSTSTVKSTPLPMQDRHTFAGSQAGQATIAVSLIGGLAVLVLLAYLLWRRYSQRKRTLEAQRRSVMAGLASDASSEDLTSLTPFEMLTGMTRAEFHARRGSQLSASTSGYTSRQVQHRAMVEPRPTTIGVPF